MAVSLHEVGVHSHSSLLIKDSLHSPAGFLIVQLLHQTLQRGEKVSNQCTTCNQIRKEHCVKGAATDAGAHQELFNAWDWENKKHLHLTH